MVLVQQPQNPPNMTSVSVLEKEISELLSRNWWLLLLRGLLAVAFGVITWQMPGVSLATFVLLFGAYCLVDGVCGIWVSVAGRKQNGDWWILLLWSLVAVGAGLLTFLTPGVTALALLFFIATWAVATGVLQIIAAIRLRREITGEWVLVLSGILSVIFGILLMANPLGGALAVLWLIATYAILFGVLMIILSFRVRSATKPAAAT